MSDTRADAWNHLEWLMLIVTAVSVAPLDKYKIFMLDSYVERVLLYFLTSVATLTHFHYGYGVVREMCEHFKIRCFKVRPNLNLNKHEREKLN